YAGFGFDYADYLPHVLAGSVASLIGNAAGHRLGHHVSETRFRLIFKLIVTLVGVRLVIKGALLLAG
ncbi:MAG: sulfite exporter TauE/SafE family protein, partial [Pseudomonadota bacterium]|nr:sulfite exporter TauE/SafE family protein [Pseudomonadota bacterium]